MHTNGRKHILLAAIGLGVVMALGRGAAAAGAQPTAEISPAQIALDQTAELRIDKSAASNAVPRHVDGLHFQRTGESTEMTNVNGSVSQHTWVLYQVVADHPGSYSIPIGGDTLTLEVGPTGSGGARAHFGPSAGSGVSAEKGAHQGTLAFLRVVLPKKKVFIGQAVPVTFKAYFRAGTEVTLSGAPSLGVPAFTISHLDDNPRQSIESIGGVPYRVATWTGQASAAMSGHFTAQATLPIVARYREASPQEPATDPFGSMFDDDDMFSVSPSKMLRSFMKQSAFGGALGDMFGQEREREMTLHAPAQGVDVLALPTKGQPAGYSGAVGHFDVRASLSPKSGSMYAPMTLKIEVTGQGNLDRVSTSGLPSSAKWKTYPPGSKITDKGTKVFEQAVVPQASGHVEIPAVSFSFFDPDLKQYVTRSTTPIGADIASTPAGAATPTVSAAPASSEIAGVSPGGLRPNHVEQGRLVSTLLPPYRRAWFWPVVAAPWFGLAGVFARPRRRGVSARGRQRALRETIARHRTAMKRAAAAGDAVRFHEAAGAALRERLGEMWRIAPDDVTAAEAAARMGPEDEPIVAALRSAERLRYGGAAEDPSSLATLRETVERKLEQLEKQPCR